MLPKSVFWHSLSTPYSLSQRSLWILRTFLIFYYTPPETHLVAMISGPCQTHFENSTPQPKIKEKDGSGISSTGTTQSGISGMLFAGLSADNKNRPKTPPRSMIHGRQHTTENLILLVFFHERVVCLFFALPTTSSAGNLQVF